MKLRRYDPSLFVRPAAPPRLVRRYANEAPFSIARKQPQWCRKMSCRSRSGS